MEYNIYCDESCHLEKDNQKSMVLGAIWCPTENRREISERIREWKRKHGLKTGYSGFELKWVKVSPAKVELYKDVLNYFFDNDDLHFRGVVIPDKSLLRHKDYHQTHDEWYYKMYFTLLKHILRPKDLFNIYIDIKDTRSIKRVITLNKYLCEVAYDFDFKIVRQLQQIRSHESEIMQIADLLIGAVSYVNRELSASSAKLELVQLIKKRSGYNLIETTLPSESKFNILVWKSSDAHDSD